MKDKCILVFGSNGLLGTSLIPYLSGKNYKVITVGRSSKLDFCTNNFKVENLKSIINKVAPDHIINLIAATNVDACESDVEMAFQSNALIPANISEAIQVSKFSNTHLIHLSTDQVYKGTGNHSETFVSPVNVYGLTKLTGESMIKTNKVAILRVNFFGKSKVPTRISFSDWIINSYKNSMNMTMFEDVRFNALHISSLCKYINIVIAMELIGTFNVGSKDGMSKSDFADKLSSLMKLDNPNSRVGRLSEMKIKVRRPLDMTMNVELFEDTLDIECPSMSEEINKTVKEYENV